MPPFDRSHLAGDVGGGVRGEEVHDPRHLFRLAEATDWDLREHPLDRLLRYGARHLGFDKAGRHRVDGDAEAVSLAGALKRKRRLARERLSQADRPDFDAA
jgi:hypothetical protein